MESLGPFLEYVRAAQLLGHHANARLGSLRVLPLPVTLIVLSLRLLGAEAEAGEVGRRRDEGFDQGLVVDAVAAHHSVEAPGRGRACQVRGRRVEFPVQRAELDDPRRRRCVFSACGGGVAFPTTQGRRFRGRGR